jgi:hypothetical protein
MLNSGNNDREQNWLLLITRVKRAQSAVRLAATVTLGCSRWHHITATVGGCMEYDTVEALKITEISRPTSTSMPTVYLINVIKTIIFHNDIHLLICIKLSKTEDVNDKMNIKHSEEVLKHI